MKKHNDLRQAEQNTYQTGSTNPPKNYQGTICVLLILVIVLGSVVSILSMLNIRLFQMLEQKEQSVLQFSTQPEAEPPEPLPEGCHVPTLGLTGQEVTNLYRSYQDWPEGVYISNVTEGSPAHRADLRPGDILLAVEGVAVDSCAALEEITATLTAGKTVTFTVFREEKELTLKLTAD